MMHAQPTPTQHQNQQTVVRIYRGKPQDAQSQFATDAALMSSQGFRVGTQTAVDESKGSTAWTVVLFILGFFTLVTWLAMPFTWPRERTAITVTYTR